MLINNHLESNKLDAHDKTVYNDILKSPREKNIKNGGKHLFHKIAKVVAVRAPQAGLCCTGYCCESYSLYACLR